MKLTFTIPFVPVSKKNNTHRITVSGRPMIAPTKKVKREQITIANAALLAITRGGLFHVPFRANEVSVTIVRHVAAETVTVTIEDLGPPPKGRTGRDRDTQNLADTICDALNGIAWNDDRQVQSITIRREP